MKKSILLSLAICILFANVTNAQGGLLKKVGKSMANELLGRPQEVDRGPEPKCACSDALVAMDLGGKIQLDYKELTISVLPDGSLLAKTNGSNEYYIVKGGAIQGPIKSEDPRIDAFEATEDDNNNVESFIAKNKPYISRSGEKFLITFNGKTYGPFAQISNFVVTKSREKFVAQVVENMLVSEADMKKMEEEAKKAKTDQEKMDISMKYAQEMQQRMMQGGGAGSTMPKFVSNIPDITYDPVKSVGTFLNGTAKYDEIIMVGYNKILDLQGNTLFSIKPEAFGAENLFVNTTNTKYAYYNYGTLTFSDNTPALSELFKPYLVKENGQVFIAYMYYSPKKNSIMQCKIAF